MEFACKEKETDSKHNEEWNGEKKPANVKYKLWIMYRHLRVNSIHLLDTLIKANANKKGHRRKLSTAKYEKTALLIENHQRYFRSRIHRSILQVCAFTLCNRYKCGGGFFFQQKHQLFAWMVEFLVAFVWLLHDLVHFSLVRFKFRHSHSLNEFDKNNFRHKPNKFFFYQLHPHRCPTISIAVWMNHFRSSAILKQNLAFSLARSLFHSNAHS